MMSTQHCVPFARYISIKHYNLLLIQFYTCFQTKWIKEREESTQTVVVKYITGVGQNLKLCPALKPISITRIRVKTYHCLGLSGYAPDETTLPPYNSIMFYLGCSNKINTRSNKNKENQNLWRKKIPFMILLRCSFLHSSFRRCFY